MTHTVVRDTGYTPSRWAFDDEVTRVFDDMLRRSIPQYDVMRSACYGLAIRYVQPRTAILDLGCSRGEGMVPLIEKFGAHNRYILVDTSEPMIQHCRERFRSMIDVSMVEVRSMDLRVEFPPAMASVVYAVLTLQFIPLEYRPTILQRIYDALLPGGALLLVEKILGATSELDSAFVTGYYEMKRANGYSQEEIDRKRLALEGIMVPVTARWNEDMLRTVGFHDIDCFWRWLNFAGWIALKR